MPSLPAWVHKLINENNALLGSSSASTPREPNRDVELTLRRSDRLMLVTVRVPDAVTLSPLVLQRRTAEAYQTIRTQLTTDKRWHPIRIWNFIPDIHGVMPGGIDRYRVFNAGRYAAYYDWYNGGAQFEALMATATGVGYSGKDLIVNVLASDQPGTPIENPRQVRAYRYSARYGPMPPCFARATIVPRIENGATTLLIGGTSSVRGERSMHTGDVMAQTRETLVNIAHLIHAAKHPGAVSKKIGPLSSPLTKGGLRGVLRSTKNLPPPLLVKEGGMKSNDLTGTGTRICASQISDTADEHTELRHLDSIRIYYTHPEHLDGILRAVWPTVDHLNAQQVDVVQAHICRADLMVEIEGTATID